MRFAANARPVRRAGAGLRWCFEERGNALVISLLVLLLLSSMAVTFVAVTKTEKQISGNSLRDSQALYAAEAGVAEGLARMSNRHSASYIGETGSPPTAGWGRYVVLSGGDSANDPEQFMTQGDGLDNDGDGTADETNEAYPEVQSTQAGLANPMDYPWVKVRYKHVQVAGVPTVVLFGDHDSDLTTRPIQNVVRGLPVIVVTSNGLRGNATRTVEVEAVKMPGPTVPGSIYTEGTLDCKGTAFHIDGNDYDPVTGTIAVGSTPLPGVVATGGVGAVDCNVPQGWNNIEGAGAVPSIAQATVNLDLQAMFNVWESMADITYNGDQANPSTAGWGTIDQYKVVCVRNGDLHLSGINGGGGVLLVEGDLVISGQFTWYGLVLCLGDVDFVGGGAGIHIYGGVMTQGDIATSGSVSGNADIYYSSTTINRISDMTTYTVCLWRER